MRISDWSSDVCSSDLHMVTPTVGPRLIADAAGLIDVARPAPQRRVGTGRHFQRPADVALLCRSKAAELLHFRKHRRAAAGLCDPAHPKLRSLLRSTKLPPSRDRKSTRLNSSH